jgi:predicted O-linked N-acetylglucosamine transferase (SPINDLY family)
MICKRLGRFELAEKILKSLVIADPKSSLNNKNLCGLYFESSRFKDVWKQVSQWLELCPQCLEAWETAYVCAFKLKETGTAKLIAQKLTKLDPSQPKFFEWEGLALHERAEDVDSVIQAFRTAHSLSPSNLFYYINSLIACDRIAVNGGSAHAIINRLASCADKIVELCRSGTPFAASGDYPLLNSAFFAAYSPVNLRDVYESYFNALELAFRDVINKALGQSRALIDEYNRSFATIDAMILKEEACSTLRQVRIGCISQNFFDHSNTQAFSGFIKYLDRTRFEVVLIHKHPTRPDWTQSWLNSLADEVVYLSDSIGCAHATLCRLDLDILFYTDLGMDARDFVLPAMRPCMLQVTGWGLPHTSGLRSIDYYFSSSLLESSKHQDEYAEKLILLDGLPCCFMQETLVYHKIEREYFMLPSDHLVIGCVQSLPIVHPDLDLIIEAISTSVPDAYFAFMCDREESSTARFMDRLAKRAPNASQKLLLLDRCYSKDFLSLCDCFDFMLDTPYYGGGITSYMSTYVGTPIVCFQGERLRDSTTAAIYRFLEISNAPICSSIPEYISAAIALARSFDLRLQIKKDTVAAAHKLYDRKEYIRSFEESCLRLVRG